MPDNRCMGCMSELDADASVCPYCGFDKSKYVSPEMTLPPGSVLANGKYLIGKTLGQGGFGVTYIALDQFLELRVAIKEYLPRNMAYRDGNSATLHWHSSVTDKRFGRDSFVKEAKKMAKMDDIPGIVRVKEVFYENDTAYIVMDYVEGDTLLKRLEKTGALDGNACFALLRPVMDSLAEAHRQGMVHRDISPDNIMLDKRGRVWLLDMGAAKELDMAQSGQGGHNSTTMIVKPGFSPLEQYASGGDIGPWTDVYAMCATIFFCMSGSTLPLATDRVLNPRLELPAIIPPNISQVLLKGLAVMPDDRIRSMEELRDAFAAALDAPDDAESRRKKEAEARQEAERRQAEESARRAAEEEAKRQQKEEAEYQRVEEKQREWQRKIEESKERAKARRQRTEQEPQQIQIAQQTETAKPQPQKKGNKSLPLILSAAILIGAFLFVLSRNQDTGNYSATNDGGKLLSENAANDASKCGDNATWTLDENGLLTISGSGKMYDFDVQYDSELSMRFSNIPWWNTREKITALKIDRGITAIGVSCFENCMNLVSVSIPDSVTSIGEAAFAGCTSLPDITIPGSVARVELNTFSSCTKLESVTLLDGVTYIGAQAFYTCDSLTEVTIPDSVTTIDGCAFAYCVSLTEITLPNSVTNLKGAAFIGCSNLSSVTIPDSVAVLGDMIFMDCFSLNSVTIPDGVTSIDGGAFANCSSLSSITIPDGVTTIGGSAFRYCDNLKSVSIPDSVTEIGEEAFAYCDNLESVSVPAGAEIAEDAFPETTVVIRR